jgi:hypothetical protein
MVLIKKVLVYVAVETEYILLNEVLFKLGFVLTFPDKD